MSSLRAAFFSFYKEMKKLTAVILGILMLSATGKAVETAWGFKAGISGSWVPGMIVPDNARITLPCVGGYGGAFFEAELADNFLLYTELCYCGRGHMDRSDFFGYVSRYFLRLSYLELPVMAGFRVADDRLTIYAGPELGVCLGGNAVSKDSAGNKISADARGLLNPVTMNLAILTTYMVTDNIGIDVKFDFGLTRTFKGEKISFGEGAMKREFINRTHNIGVQLGVCYKFD